MGVLEEAALYLFSSSIPMSLTYGKLDVAGAALTQRSILRGLMLEPNFFQSDFLSFFRDLEYKTVLA